MTKAKEKQQEPEQDAPEQDAPEQEASAELAHSAGGTTTRDDANDLGVPMLPGSPAEPVGPEDALGEGPKRGDYSDRVSGLHYEGSTPQTPRVADVGDAEGLKGGVDTASA